MVRIKLEPMFAKKKTALGTFDVPVGQNIVLAATGKHDAFVRVGYICDAPGSPFNGLHEFRVLPDGIKEDIVRETLKELKRPDDNPDVVEPPPPRTYNPKDFE